MTNLDPTNQKLQKGKARQGIFKKTGLVLALACAIILNAQGQQIKVSGKVVDEAGEPIPGAAVQVEGSTRGVTTDVDGSFSIDVPKASKLKFSFLGMEERIIQVDSPLNTTIALKARADEMEEVTVVAFAKQKKESVLASITTVTPSELRVPSSNLTTALAGRIAGVISYQRSGEPGADNADFFIRGVTTFGYKSDPLILIDGVELSKDDLARLQVDDIGSFSIMKDASATALYGARGANGVILVTTKTGVEGPAKISARVETSLSGPTQKTRWADPITYMKLQNEAVITRDPLGVLPHSLQKIEGTEAGLNPYVFPATDWRNQLLRDNTVNMRANMSISGGGSVARYYVGISYNKDQGMLKTAKQNNFNNNINLNKYQINSNVNINLTKTTEVIARLHATMDDYTGPIDSGSDLYRKINMTSPVAYPAYYEESGNYNWTPYLKFGNYLTGYYVNPYADMVKGYRQTKSSLMSAQLEVKQNFDFIAKGLNGRLMYNTNRRSEYGVRRQYNPFYFILSNFDPSMNRYFVSPLNPDQGTDYLDAQESSKDVIQATQFESQLNYDRTNGKHGVSSLLVFQLRDELTSKDVGGNLQKSLPARNLVFSGRFTYSYDSRYFLEANFGYNGSERFAAKERFGFFPSIGGGYILSNESFWSVQMKRIIHKLKFKATYGLSGNDAIGGSDERFFYLSEVKMGDANYAYTWGSMNSTTVNGISAVRYANPNITWETAKKINLGIEIGFLRDFELQVDVFQDHRSNILQARSAIPSTMGFAPGVTPQSNFGEAITRGVDISLDFNKSFNKNLWISGRANFTYSHGEYTKFEEPDYSDTPWKSKIGRPIKQEWGYVAQRLFVDDFEVASSPTQFGIVLGGDIKYVDVNGDGVITTLDQVPIGFPTTPEITYGFGVSLGFYGFDLSCFFQGLSRESLFLNYNKIAPFIDNNSNDKKFSTPSYTDRTKSVTMIGQNQLLDVIARDHWSENNPDLYAFWPRLSNNSSPNNSVTSTWWMRNGSFLRLKSAELGYSLPKRILRGVGIANLRIYYSGTNLLCFSHFKLWDPEMGSDGFSYPIQRVHNLGINITF